MGEHPFGKYRVYEFIQLEDNLTVWLVWCSMCRTHHPYDSGRWTFNGDYDNPTFRESMLVKREGYVCHSYVTDGMIQYLPDCTHELKGKTIPLEKIKLE